VVDVGEKRGWFWSRKQWQSSQCSLFFSTVVVKLQPLDFLHLHAVTLKGLGTMRMTVVVLDFFFFFYSLTPHTHTGTPPGLREKDEIKGRGSEGSNSQATGLPTRSTGKSKKGGATVMVYNHGTG